MAAARTINFTLNGRPLTADVQPRTHLAVQAGLVDSKNAAKRHIQTGGLKLDGLTFSVYVNWPGAIHEGNGEALLLIDERADVPQRAAIEELLGGKIGGPWEILGWTWPKVHGPYPVAYDLAFDGVKTRIKCGNYVQVECGPIRNPVTGAESYPAVVLPQGIILKRGDLGATTLFRVSNGIEYDHSGKYMAVGKFEYAWP